jgi:hypothetical protein
MKYAIEITSGEWYGVALPEWLRFFDCRNSDSWSAPKAPWGESIYGGERAQIDLGLKRGYYEDNNATTLVSCSTYIDSRTACMGELTRQVTNMIEAAERFRRDYERYKSKITKPEDCYANGGSCFYLPVAAEMSNFGWSIIADDRSRIVVAFGS